MAVTAVAMGSAGSVAMEEPAMVEELEVLEVMEARAVAMEERAMEERAMEERAAAAARCQRTSIRSGWSRSASASRRPG